jgi:CRP-like cAMP-binding protein
MNEGSPGLFKTEKWSSVEAKLSNDGEKEIESGNGMNNPPLHRSDLKNSILRALPENEFQRLAPHLEKITLEAGKVLHEVGEPSQPVYFLEDGIASETLTDNQGKGIELVVVGNEGLMGERAIFGRRSLVEFRCVMFDHSTAYKIDPDRFREEFKRGKVLHDLIMSRIEARLIETSQTALCAQLHSIEERIARWLLTLAYRSRRNHFHVTQEHISNMLGVRRPTISLLMGGLREAGIVEYSRSNVTLLDLSALENETCECYEVIKKATHFPFE